MYDRAYTLQIPFILTVYILYVIKNICSRRRLITMIFIVLFIFYLSFLHFFRYPYSMFKKYTVPLNLDRAKGILVSPSEKELYESLSSYLSSNFKEEDKMVVVGPKYYPQIGFLTEQKHIFEDEEFIFMKLQAVLDRSFEKEELKPLLSLMEDKIISKMQKEKPKILLIITDERPRAKNLQYLSSRIKTYIKKNYSLRKVFGPGDLYGLGGAPAQINLYRYVKDKRVL